MCHRPFDVEPLSSRCRPLRERGPKSQGIPIALERLSRDGRHRNGGVECPLETTSPTRSMEGSTTQVGKFARAGLRLGGATRRVDPGTGVPVKRTSPTKGIATKLRRRARTGRAPTDPSYV